MRSGGVVEAQVHGDAPLLEQPFGDVDPIPVLLAPGAELDRGRIRLWRELQASHPQLELGGERRDGRHGTPPIWVAALANSNWESRRYRHRPRSYAASGGSAGIRARMAHGLRMLS